MTVASCTTKANIARNTKRLWVYAEETQKRRTDSTAIVEARRTAVNTLIRD